MEQIQNTTKCCGTCTYWFGDREVSLLGYVEVLSKTDRGRCGANIPTDRRQYQACYRCSKYDRWTALYDE